MPTRLASYLALALMLLGACGDDGSTGAPDARPGDDPDAAANTPDAAPRPDAVPGQPDASPVAGGGNFTERIIDMNDGSGDVEHVQGTELVDMDSDGDLDVIASYSRSDNVYLYLNGGDGTSWTRVTIAPRDTLVAMDVAARDIDDDGDLDIAAISLFQRGEDFASEGDVVWYENPGGDLTDTWTRHDISLLWGARSLASADLDGDELPDLVVSAVYINSEGNGVYWFRNTGGGFEGPAAIDAAIGAVSSVEVSDIDGDGDIDVVAASNDDTRQIAWYENGGEGGAGTSFTKHTVASGAEFYAVFIANVDGDGDREIIASRNNTLVWYDPTADKAQAWTANDIASFGGSNDLVISAADLDGDGDMDVAASTRPEAEVRVFLREGAGWAEAEVANGYAASFINIGDINGDLRYDLVTSTYGHSGGDRLAWWENAE